MSGPSAGTILVLSQVYPPDPTSVGQHVADAAESLAARGHRVVVFTADRGYDDPRVRYPRRELRAGVEVRRLPLSSFGKQSILVRLLGGGLFVLQGLLRGLFLRDLSGILVSTSPPMASVAAVGIASARRAPVTFWSMDLNPDQMIALGRIAADSWPARIFDTLNRMILRRARAVVALDRFMAERLRRKLDVGSRMHVLPPWPHEDHLESVEHADNPFRRRHALEGKFVIAYSGNHGPSNPITTALRAAERLRSDERFVFLFIGGGIGKREVEQAIAEGATNVRSLPYQPLADLKYSLSAADLHLVTMGDDVVGIVHPCKVYGAMAVARPVLLLGPAPSHIADLLERHRCGWRVGHGEVEAMADLLRRIAALPPEELRETGERGRRAIDHDLSKAALCGRFCDIVEGRAGSASAPSPPARRDSSGPAT